MGSIFNFVTSLVTNSDVQGGENIAENSDSVEKSLKDPETELLSGSTSIHASQIIEDDVKLLAKRRLKRSILSGNTDKIIKTLEKYNAQILNISEALDPPPRKTGKNGQGTKIYEEKMKN